MKLYFRPGFLAVALLATQAVLARQMQDDRVEASPHQHASSPTRTPHASPLVVPLDAALLATLPREAVTATAHEKTLHCEGVSLAALLRSAGALDSEPLHGTRLANYVLVTARDGYRAVYSLAELEPTLGNHPVLLVDRCEGKALADDDGPLRLIAPTESRPARWVRQVQSITVVTSP
ncbi:MAG TPA: molybdopterin-dependent oxidoreductase [Pseudoxanthomonas sp.]|nr:molybdopterin-dependent oxidoreductase [Pseudoxanthomonas sp.]